MSGDIIVDYSNFTGLYFPALTTVRNLNVTNNYMLGYMRFPVLYRVTGMMYIHTNPMLTSVDWSMLYYGWSFYWINNYRLTYLSFPSLYKMGQGFYVWNNTQLVTIDVPELTEFGELSAMDTYFSIYSNDRLLYVYTPKLYYVGWYWIWSNAQLISLSAPWMYYVGHFLVQYNPLLVSLDYPLLSEVGYSFDVKDNDILYCVNFPVLTTVGTFGVVETSSAADCSNTTCLADSVCPSPPASPPSTNALPEEERGRYRSKHVAHGLLMVFAWGLLFPASAAASLGWGAQAATGKSLAMYQGIQGFALAFVLIAMIIAITMVPRGRHFDTPHHVVGIVIIILAWLLSLVNALWRTNRGTWELVHVGSICALICASVYQVVSGSRLMYYGLWLLILFLVLLGACLIFMIMGLTRKRKPKEEVPFDGVAAPVGGAVQTA